MKYLTIITITTFFLLIISCEKVIEIDLPGNEPALVIEGYLEKDSLCVVQLSSTIDIFDGKTPDFITDAVITISDNQGTTETLLYQDFGRYKGTLLRGQIGNTYTLSVQVNNQEYKASSTILSAVPIDSIQVKEGSDIIFIGAGGEDYKSVYVHYTDPSTTPNNYLLKFLYIPNSNNDNAYSLDRTYLRNDDNKNGLPDSAFLFSQPLQTGDIIIAELRSIDQAVFDYYFSIEDALVGNSFTSAAPANPKSNFSNGALGYFGAWSKEVEFFVVP